jgi:hypothetical protein
MYECLTRIVKCCVFHKEMTGPSLSFERMSFLRTWKYWYKYRLNVVLDVVLNSIAKKQYHVISIYQGELTLDKSLWEILTVLLSNFLLCNLNISYPVPTE